MMTGFTMIATQAALLFAASPYAVAHKQSAETGRPLVVLVGTDWCPHCRTMKAAVIPEIKQQGLLAKVAFATVDSDRQPQLASKLMQGGSIPQLVMFWKTGRQWHRSQLTGAQDTASVVKFLNHGITDVAKARSDTTHTASRGGSVTATAAVGGGKAG